MMASGSLARHSLLLVRLQLRDSHLLFWNVAFFLLLLVVFLAFLSAGNEAVRVALTAAVVAVGVMANALFSVGVGLAAARERGVFRAYQVTSAHLGELLLATTLARALIVFTGAAAQMLAARLLFGVAWTGSVIGGLATLAMGTAAFAAFGFAIAAATVSTRAANRSANLVLLPVMALGGTSLPASMLPEAIGRIRWLLPVAPLQDGLTGALVHGDGLVDQGPRLALLFAWTLAAALLGVRAWRRSDRRHVE